jgi:purine-binding chemotaxis protein CheW
VDEVGVSSRLSVVCRVGSLLCAISVEHVSEIMRPLAIEPLAGMPSYMSGVSIIRGVPTPVVDAARLLGVQAVPTAPRFLALRIGPRRAALAVDAVVGVRALSPESFEDLPPLLGDANQEVIEGIGTLDAELLLALRHARMIPPSVWGLLDGAGPRA